MITSLFTQKNVCAALGFLMALTIVLKANHQTKLTEQTARFEYTKPTTEIGTVSIMMPLDQAASQKNKSIEASYSCFQWT